MCIILDPSSETDDDDLWIQKMFARKGVHDEKSVIEEEEEEYGDTSDDMNATDSELIVRSQPATGSTTRCTTHNCFNHNISTHSQHSHSPNSSQIFTNSIPTLPPPLQFTSSSPSSSTSPSLAMVGNDIDAASGISRVAYNKKDGFTVEAVADKSSVTVATAIPDFKKPAIGRDHKHIACDTWSSFVPKSVTSCSYPLGKDRANPLYPLED